MGFKNWFVSATRCDTYVEVIVGSTTVTVLSWLTQASLFPLAEKQTLWTQPPLPAPPNSAITCPNGILDPHGVGAGFSSTSLMYAENTLRKHHFCVSNCDHVCPIWTSRKIGNLNMQCLTCIWSHMTQLPEAHCLDASLDWEQSSGWAFWCVC